MREPSRPLQMRPLAHCIWCTCRKVKVDKMSANLQFVGVAKPKSHSASIPAVAARQQRWHCTCCYCADRPVRAVVFVDDEEEAKSFDAAKHFNTAPELVDRHFNRPTKEQLKSEKLIKKRLSRKELNRIESAKAAAYTELVSRPPAGAPASSGLR
eukprot:COSAG02_NODE_555_length_20407_cov_11.072878_11_plen_155_part_00